MKCRDEETDNSSRIFEILAESYEDQSSNSNYNLKFALYKAETEQVVLTNPRDYAHPLNANFTSDELDHALSSCKNSSPGPDGILNIFL